jgi:microsomal dipeptidase-like Zn-dependent dipeptidase
MDALRRRGYSEVELVGIGFNNLVRVLKQVQYLHPVYPFVN